MWGRTGSVSAYVSLHAPKERWESLRRELAALAGVERAELVTPAQALARFRARDHAAAELVDGVGDDILPASIELYLRSGFADLRQVEAVAKEAAAVAGIESVDFGQEEFSRLNALLALLRYGGFAVGLLMTAATAFIVSNTIRLTVYARRDEIAILRLVGATHGFIRMPFLLEGALWGSAGGGLGVLGLFATDRWLAPRLSHAVADATGGLAVRLFSPQVGVILLVSGVFLGVVGSALAVRRFLDVETA